MRIISDFRDYYDGVQGAYDKHDRQYIRQKKVVKVDKWPFPECYHTWHWIKPWDTYKPLIIGFCGKIYPAIICHYHAVPGDYVREKKFLFSLNDLLEWVESRKYRSTIKRLSVDVPDEMFNFFQRCDKKKDSFSELFVTHQSPVFLADQEALVADDGKPKKFIEFNAQLKPVEFYRVFDTHSAFQEIRMWWDNQAEPRKPIPHIDDVTLAEAKGFNKFSFRKDPSKK